VSTPGVPREYHPGSAPAQWDLRQGGHVKASLCDEELALQCAHMYVPAYMPMCECASFMYIYGSPPCNVGCSGFPPDKVTPDKVTPVGHPSK
jgi:hypothetical protein